MCNLLSVCKLLYAVCSVWNCLFIYLLKLLLLRFRLALFIHLLAASFNLLTFLDN